MKAALKTIWPDNRSLVLSDGMRLLIGTPAANGNGHVVESVLLAIVIDRMRAFNEGEYRCRENALVLTKCEEALHWLKSRADDRARRKVLGTYEK